MTLRKEKLRKEMGRAICMGMLFISLTARGETGNEGISVGAGKAKFNGLLQAWGLYDSKATSIGKFNFRLRRAEIKLSGSVIENTRWFVMIDPAKTLKVTDTTVSGKTFGAVSASNDNKILQDVGVAWSICPDLELVVGQFKTPTTSEGLESSSELLFPERSIVARTWGDKREPGAMINYKYSLLKFMAMVSNGQNPNVDDTNNEKDLNLRAEAKPTDEVQVGVFNTAADFKYSKKSRIGMNAKYAPSAWLFRGEGVYANDNSTATWGWVFDVAYTIAEKWQPAFRYDSIRNTQYTSYGTTFGLNYLMSKHNAKIQAAVGILNDLTGNSGGTYAVQRGTSGVLSVLSFQAAI